LYPVPAVRCKNKIIDSLFTSFSFTTTKACAVHSVAEVRPTVMAIVKDVVDVSGAPPPYAAPNNNVQHAGSSLSSPSQAGQFGPTPIGNYFPHHVMHHPHHHGGGPTIAFLPYHDPHSPYALAQAERRAMRRFWGALIWAIGVYMLMGMFAGSVADEAKGRRGRGGGPRDRW